MHSFDPGDIIGGMVALLIFGGPMVYFIVNRIFTHNERMEMLKRGIMPPPDMKAKGKYYNVQFGAAPPPVVRQKIDPPSAVNRRTPVFSLRFAGRVAARRTPACRRLTCYVVCESH